MTKMTKKRLKLAYLPYRLPVVGLIAGILLTLSCVICDYLSITALWTSINAATYWVYKKLSSYILCVSLDVPCMIAGSILQKGFGKNKVVIISCLIISGAAWLLYAVCRLAVAETWVSGLLMAVLPLLSNGVSFIVGYLLVDFDIIKKLLAVKKKILIETEVMEIEAEISTAMDEDSHMRWVLGETLEAIESTKSIIKAESATLKTKARIEIAKRGDSEDIQDISDDMGDTASKTRAEISQVNNKFNA